MKPDMLGHNARRAMVTIESRLFNSLTKYSGTRSSRETFTLPAGATIRDVLEVWGLPKDEVFLVLRNGRDVTPGLVGADGQRRNSARGWRRHRLLRPGSLQLRLRRSGCLKARSPECASLHPGYAA